MRADIACALRLKSRFSNVYAFTSPQASATVLVSGLLSRLGVGIPFAAAGDDPAQPASPAMNGDGFSW